MKTNTQTPEALSDRDDYSSKREEFEAEGYELVQAYGFDDTEVYKLNLHAAKLENQGFKVEILQSPRGYQIFKKAPSKDEETTEVQQDTREEVKLSLVRELDNAA